MVFKEGDNVSISDPKLPEKNTYMTGMIDKIVDVQEDGTTNIFIFMDPPHHTCHAYKNTAPCFNTTEPDSDDYTAHPITYVRGLAERTRSCEGIPAWGDKFTMTKTGQNGGGGGGKKRKSKRGKSKSKRRKSRKKSKTRRRRR